jgi:hypothetical protein
MTISGIITTGFCCVNDKDKITNMRAHWDPAELRAERYAGC